MDLYKYEFYIKISNCLIVVSVSGSNECDGNPLLKVNCLKHLDSGWRM